MKKQLIMEKALELFAKQGFEATSVQQITEHCGISKGAFYLSFKSKDELIVALVDHFMEQFTSDTDYIVRSTVDEGILLYEFYYTTFQSFHKHSDFAKILMKEQSQSLNEDLFLKLHAYDRLFENIILTMIDRLYGEMVKETKFDLIYCIKGFINTYAQLFIFYNVPLDLGLLSKSLVEKTNLLAHHTTIPFITEEMNSLLKQPLNQAVTPEQLLEILEKKIEEIEGPVEKESLRLLRQQLLEPTPTYSSAIVRGLIENIRTHPHCKWIAFLLRRHFQFE